jgi:Mg2+/Co2+ transporter CorC
VNELFDVELPHDDWDTVAGLVYGLVGAVPTQGQAVSYDGSGSRSNGSRAGASPRC